MNRSQPFELGMRVGKKKKKGDSFPDKRISMSHLRARRDHGESSRNQSIQNGWSGKR